MKRIAIVLLGVTLSCGVSGQQTYDEHALNITMQVLSFDSCVDKFAERYSGADASPSEIATSALYECRGYHERMFSGVKALVLDTLPPGDNKQQSSLDERVMATTLKQYEDFARDQRVAANERAINIIVKSRMN